MTAGALYKIGVFLRSSFFLSFSSSIVPQAISFIGMLLLARLYTPEDYGRLAFGMAVAAVLSVLISLRYESAVVVAEEEDVFPLIFLVLVFSVFVCVSCGLFMLFIGWEWFWVLAFSLGQVSLSLVASYWMRSESFFYVLLIRSAAALLNFIFPFLFFLWGVENGLMSGLMVASLLIFVFLVVLFFCYVQIGGLRGFCKILKRYFYFTGKSLPGYLVNTFSYQAGYFMIPSYYGEGVAGSYFQSFRIGYFPMSMLSTAAAQFFYARASKLKCSSDLRMLMFRLHALMFVGVLPYCIFIYLWPDVLVSFVLGESWMGVAECLPYLTWFFFLSSIVSSTSSVFHLYRRGWFELFFNLLLAVIPVALVLWLEGEDFQFFLIWYAILSGALYFYLLIWSYVKCDSLEG